MQTSTGQHRKVHTVTTMLNEYILILIALLCDILRCISTTELFRFCVPNLDAVTNLDADVVPQVQTLSSCHSET